MKSKLRKWSWIAAGLAGLFLLGWISFAVTRYLRSAELFAVQQVSVAGVERLKENEVIAAAELQSGANIFAVDMDAVRDRVEKLRRVQHALVQRILPDQIVIKVFERVPSGAAVIRGEVYQFDDDGVLLEPGPGTGSFAILHGLKSTNPAANRTKIDLYRKVLRELEPEASFSEVHVNDRGEVSVVASDMPQIVDLGTEAFKERWLSYVRLKPEIEKLPKAARVDLRFKDQVIVKMNSGEAEERVVWGAEKNSL
jgi:cell division septal protein FtsQ